MEQRKQAWLTGLAVLLLGVVWQSREAPPQSSAASVRVVFVATGLERQLAPVVDAFRANFEEGREHGAQLAVYHRGKLALSLAGGAMDASTRTTVFSSPVRRSKSACGSMNPSSSSRTTSVAFGGSPVSRQPSPT